jgi:UPF0755 protein
MDGSIAPQPIGQTPTGLDPKKPFPWKKALLFGGLGLGVILLGGAIGALLWYHVQLSPVSSNDNEHIRISIAPNTTPSQIGQLLEDENVIRSAKAFGYYTRFTGTQNNLQAGSYRLSPADSTPEIVEHLTSGNVDTFDITFLPGSTLAQNRQVLIDAGYSENEITTAFAATYNSPLFVSKPAEADLEGYIYGNTYRFGTDATVEQILAHVFEVYYSVIEENDLVAQYQAQGLTLYEGITLASIIQRESVGGDEPQIAQVFYLRLASDMALGSDVTYQYIADKEDLERSPDLDSPYNTRKYTGLPPGPIAVPGLASLKAVGEPAEGDYLYFLSGDDDITYFARTLSEHEQNIVDHCKEKCQIL